MTESALYQIRVSIEKALRGIISKEQAGEMLISLQLALTMFLISETKNISRCIAQREVYAGSPEYNLCCKLIERLGAIVSNVSFMEWYAKEHGEQN